MLCQPVEPEWNDELKQRLLSLLVLGCQELSAELKLPLPLAFEQLVQFYREQSIASVNNVNSVLESVDLRPHPAASEQRLSLWNDINSTIASFYTSTGSPESPTLNRELGVQSENRLTSRSSSPGLNSQRTTPVRQVNVSADNRPITKSSCPTLELTPCPTKHKRTHQSCATTGVSTEPPVKRVRPEEVMVCYDEVERANGPRIPALSDRLAKYEAKRHGFGNFQVETQDKHRLDYESFLSLFKRPKILIAAQSFVNFLSGSDFLLSEEIQFGYDRVVHFWKILVDAESKNSTEQLRLIFLNVQFAREFRKVQDELFQSRYFSMCPTNI
jgi:hypothetical protein